MKIQTTNPKALMSKLLGGLFIKVNSLVWDLGTGKTAIKKGDRFLTCDITTDEDGKPSGQVTDNLAFATFEVPAFATRVSFADLKAGDIILNEEKAVHGWILADGTADSKSLKLMTVNGTTTNYTPIKVASALGVQGPMVVRNLFNMPGVSQEGAGALTNILPMLMLSGNSDLGDSLPLLMLSGALGSGQQANSMLPLLLLSGKKSGGLKDSLPLLMMSGAMGGGAADGANGMNPMMLALMADGDMDPLTMMAFSGMLNPSNSTGAAFGLNPLMLMALLKGEGTVDGLFSTTEDAAPALTPVGRNGAPLLQPIR